MLPAWVAEMDFPVAAPIRDALVRTAEDADLGYPLDEGPDWIEVLGADRIASLFGWRPDPDLGFKLTDVMRGVIHGITAFTQPGDGVIVMTPIYPPFLGAISDNHRRDRRGAAAPDRGGLPARCRRARRRGPRRGPLLLWCNPHNPYWPFVHP